MQNSINEQVVLAHYLACALWSSTDDNCEPLDAAYGLEDIALATLVEAETDVRDFVRANLADLKEANLTDEQIGHDFWLTRNGHGAGFWDRGLGPVGDKISDAARAYGSVDLYVGDDGLIYA